MRSHIHGDGVEPLSGRWRELLRIQTRSRTPLRALCLSCVYSSNSSFSYREVSHPSVPHSECFVTVIDSFCALSLVPVVRTESCLRAHSA